MLSNAEVLELATGSSVDRVLSVYLNGRSRDPAARDVWRTVLRTRLQELRESLNDRSHAEREAFDQSVQHLMAEFAVGRGVGWVFFITAEGVLYAEKLSAPADFLIAWESRPVIGPYILATPLQSMIIAILDHRRARLYRYGAGVLEKLDTLRAYAHVDDLTRSRGGPTGRFHPGVRGSTGADALQRQRRAGFERLVGELRAKLLALSADGDAILFGGIPQAARAAFDAVHADVMERAAIAHDLSIGATDAMIRAAAERSLQRMHEERVAAQLEEIRNEAGAHARGVFGVEATKLSLEEGAVECLLVSREFMRSHVNECEAMIRSALSTGGRVEELATSALEDEAVDVAARLRFALV